MVDLTDKLNGALDVERLLKEKQTQLIDQVAQQKRVMDAHGLTILTDTQVIPPRVDGVVLAQAWAAVVPKGQHIVVVARDVT